MAEQGAPVLQIRGVRKDYRGLRPLRVAHLDLFARQSVALVGFDQMTAEVLVNLVTGASVPDEGDVRIFGLATTEIADADAWLKMLDRFGIVSERAVLLDAMSAEQNLAIPLTLDFEGMPDSTRLAVRALAEEVGLTREDLSKPVAALTPLARLRLRLGRALALRPDVLLAEHPNASIPPQDVATFAADYGRIVGERGIASLTLTADATFAAAIADRVLTLNPATGDLKPASGWRRWF